MTDPLTRVRKELSMTASLPTFLDCTLRDGGYYTAWDFTDRTVEGYLRAAARLPLDIIELGYANLPRTGYFGKYYFLTGSAANHAKSLLREDQRLGIMLDEKVVPLESLDHVVGDVADVVNLVRISVAPQRLAFATRLGERLREMGFDVGINVMYLSKYWNAVEDLPGLADAAAVSSCLSLVDSYGACIPEQTAAAVSTLRQLHPETATGFHGHDNLGLAFANSLSAIGAGAAVIDGTITGMGRGPGNTRTEVLLAYAYSERPDELDYVALSDIVEPFETMKQQYGWGTNLVYMISGAAGLPQNRVMDWLGKNRYSVPAIIHAMQNESLGSIDETPYETLAAVPEYDRDTEVIVIGGGPTVQEHAVAIREYASRSGAVVIHANYRHLELVRSIQAPQFVVLAGDVADRLPAAGLLELGDGFIVPTAPRIRPVPSFARASTRQVEPFVMRGDRDQFGPVSDIGPLSLALGAALALNAVRLTLVGFDGYAHATSSEQELAKESQLLLDQFIATYPGIIVTSATRTRYDVAVESIYSRLGAIKSNA